jgi:hypothetical protein
MAEAGLFPIIIKFSRRPVRMKHIFRSLCRHKSSGPDPVYTYTSTKKKKQMEANSLNPI